MNTQETTCSSKLYIYVCVILVSHIGCKQMMSVLTVETVAHCYTYQKDKTFKNESTSLLSMVLNDYIL